MFSRIINDTSRVIRVTIVVDATTRSITYYRHSDDSEVIIYDCKIVVINEYGWRVFTRTLFYESHHINDPFLMSLLDI